MPELPEVETTLKGIKPFIIQQKIKHIVIRVPKLRWDIPKNLPKLIIGKRVKAVSRRGKYLLVELDNGTLIFHLGMSGSIKILKKWVDAKKHDHVDIQFQNGICLRFRDPRRFGALLWTEEKANEHVLLKNLGPEPLEKNLNGHYLWQKSKNRKIPIKTFIMDSKVVVGVGNIYANEALFIAGIHPKKVAGKISLSHYEKLAEAIKETLKAAIKKGGTTIQDFVDSKGNKGYFDVYLRVYGRGGKNCLVCQSTLKEIRLGQRSTVFCGECQK